MRFPKDITERLVKRSNPSGDITNTDLELVGSVMHQECGAQCFDIRERTSLSCTDNTGTLYWQRKGSTTTDKVAAEVLRVQAMHRRYHRYVRLHDYLPGPLNGEADDASRFQDLTNTQFLAYFSKHYPQTQSWRMWSPTPAMRSSMIGALRNTRQPTASWQVEPQPRTPIETFGPPSAPTWPSTHFLKTSPIQRAQGRMDFRLTRQISYYKKQDPPPDRVKPVPVTVIRHILYAAMASAIVSTIAIADMIALAFFFLLRPQKRC
jgi:hypothetical protein